MSVKCEICNKDYSSMSNLNKHKKKKHSDVLSKVIDKVCYKCNYCNETFNLKKELVKHIDLHMNRTKLHTNIICQFDNCRTKLNNFKLLISHLQTDHNQIMKIELINFNTMEEFDEWKKQIEDRSNSQYVITSKKQRDSVEYIYFDCHRSYNPRLSNKGEKNSKPSVKIGYVCPSRIRLHKKGNNVEVQYHSTHLWHANEIGKLRLHKNDRSQLAGKLSMGVPVQRILNDVRDSVTGTEIKRIHLLEKKDLHNIRRDFNITYSTKHHSNDAVSVKLWVDRIKSKSDESRDDHSPILYFKPQGEKDTNVPHFTENDFCFELLKSTNC